MSMLYSQLAIVGVAVIAGIVWAVVHKVLDQVFPDSKAVALGESVHALIDHVAGQKIGDAVVHTFAEKMADIQQNHAGDLKAFLDKEVGAKVGDQVFATVMDRLGALMSGVVAPVPAPAIVVADPVPAPAVTTTTTTTVPAA